MNWVQTVVEAHKESEAPEKFFYWAALSAISAVVRKNIYLERYYYKLYPNIYVFLVAASGMKKGVPVNLAKTLADKAGAARIISGRNSVQRIIQDLGKAHSLENGGVIRDAQGFLVSGELSSFLVKDPDALTILTDLHDTHAYEKEWINSLKGTGVDKLKQPCITLLGATNEEHFADAVPQNAIGGGFIARTFIVYSQERVKLNSLTEKPKIVINTDLLAEYLKRLAKIKPGSEFQWTDKSKKLYDDWYYPFNAVNHHDPTGTMNRIGDQALKAAMLLSLADDDSLVIKEGHVFEGITVALECINGMQMVTMGAGKANLAFQTKLVLRELLLAPSHQIERKKLLQKYWGQFDAFDMDRIAETLEATGCVQICQNGKNCIYVLTKAGLELYKKMDFQIRKTIQ